MIKRTRIFLALLITLFFYGFPVFAADVPPIGLNMGKQPSGVLLTSDHPGDLLGLVIKNTITIFFAIGAIGFTIMIVWGGVSWIISGGDKEKVANARKRIITAVTGLVVLSLSYVIMVILGQITGIKSLEEGNFKIPTLYNK